MYTVVHLQQHDTAPFTNNNANKTQHYFFPLFRPLAFGHLQK
jgi:hypothetical protein